MQNAKKWVKNAGPYESETGVNGLGGYVEWYVDDAIDVIKQIQLDAWKQGMNDALAEKPYSASEDCDEQEQISWGQGYNTGLSDFSGKIMKLRDSKTII